jgi:hypothetical protein
MTDRRRPAAWRDLGDGWLGLWVAFENKDRAKAIPSAKWDAYLKCWRIRPTFVAEVELLVYELNQHLAPTTPARSLIDALAGLRDALPPELRRPVRRALVRVLHPDHGGNHEAMVALNRTWEDS